MKERIKKKPEIAILSLILILGLFMRTFNLWQVPMYGDELTIIYDSYSLLKNGTDQLGNSYPITFQMGEGRPAGYVYGSIPFVAVFGLNIWGVRALSILSGLGIILCIYFLARGLGLKKAGIVAACFCAIAPWAVNLSRGGFESNFALFLALLGFTCLLYAKSKKYLLLIAAFSFAVVIHTYPTFKLTLPLVLLLFVWYTDGIKWLFGKKTLNLTIFAIIVLSLAAIVSIYQTLNAGSENRFAKINIFTEESANRWLRERVSMERSVSEVPKFIAPLFHNRFLEYPTLFLSSYFKNLSVEFLFLTGDRNPRHNMAATGTFYFIEILLVLFGMYTLFRMERRVFWLLFGWMLTAPLATAALGDTHLLRNSFLFPPIVLFSAVGMIGLWAYRKSMFSRIVLIGLVSVFIVEFGLFSERLLFVAPNEFSRFWSYSAKAASEMALAEKAKFDFIILSSTIENAEYGYLSYAKIDPKLAIEQNKNWTLLNGVRFKNFGNVYIGEVNAENAEKFALGLNGRVLYITDIEQYKYIPDAIVYYGTEGAPMFLVKEFKQKND